MKNESGETSSTENVKTGCSAWWLLTGPALWSWWVVSFYSYCLRVRIALGHHPYSISDHAGLNNSLHSEFVWRAIAPLLALLVLWTVALGVALVVSRRMRNWGTIASMVAGWLIAVTVAWPDPGGWFDWFCD